LISCSFQKEAPYTPNNAKELAKVFAAHIIMLTFLILGELLEFSKKKTTTQVKKLA